VLVIGIDEVGRGCWAGPLVVGAVILNKGIDGITDSKLLSSKKRQLFNSIIRSQAVDYALGWVSSDELNKIGLTLATSLAIERALEQINVDYDQIIIDGNFNYLIDNPKATHLIKADQLVPSVSAASILAKVARDAYMINMAKLYPGYGFDSHVGYGTEMHLASLELLGPCDLHRLSFKPVANIANKVILN
jgi:ribonuclease HII